MTEQNDLGDFATRAEVERMKSESALDPIIASIHAQLAESYDRMAKGLIKQRPVRSMAVASPSTPGDRETDFR